MRRKRFGSRVRRVVAGVVVLGSLLALGGIGVTFARACAAPLEVYSPLAAMQRDWATPPPQRGDGPPVDMPILGAPVRTAGHSVLSALLRVKQSNALAYPLHQELAESLEWAHCRPDAVRAQWLKAGRHAARPDQVAVVVQGLERSIGDAADRAALIEEVHAIAEQEPWHAGMRAVLAALAASA
jgi:hypothetical protein